MLRFVFPCMPYTMGTVEPMFEEQREAARERGFETSLLSYEDLHQEQRVWVRPPGHPDETVVLRGWMLSPADYALIEQRDWQLLTSAHQYSQCHFMGGWVEALRGFTPDTVELACEQEPVQELLARWGQAFVKDSVKSYSAEGLPIVSSWDELVALKQKMDLYRGRDEDVLFFRQVESLEVDSELRLFVLHGIVHHPNAPLPARQLGEQVASRIDAPFYSVDVIRRSDGVWRVVELGDGQVSDLKEWTPQQFFSIWPSP